MSKLNRLRWKCRRGTLELDLLLNQFLDRDFAALDRNAQQAFETLLEAGDEELWALISGGQASVSPTLQPVIERLRAC